MNPFPSQPIEVVLDGPPAPGVVAHRRGQVAGAGPHLSPLPACMPASKPPADHSSDEWREFLKNGGPQPGHNWQQRSAGRSFDLGAIPCPEKKCFGMDVPS